MISIIINWTRRYFPHALNLFLTRDRANISFRVARTARRIKDNSQQDTISICFVEINMEMSFTDHLSMTWITTMCKTTLRISFDNQSSLNSTHTHTPFFTQKLAMKKKREKDENFLMERAFRGRKLASETVEKMQEVSGRKKEKERASLDHRSICERVETNISNQRGKEMVECQDFLERFPITRLSSLVDFYRITKGRISARV